MSDQSAQPSSTEAPKPVPAPKPSPVEGIKSQSNFLRGEIAADLRGEIVGVGKSSEVLLKFHGTYQQDDRDARKEAKKAGGKSFTYMVRTKIPGGKMTAAQLLAEIDLCDEIGNTTVRVTTRQGLQHHGIVKQNLRQAIKRINEIQLTTLAACGDVNRNVLACPAPFAGDAVRARMQELCDQLTEHFYPKTRAYHELWIRDEDGGEEELAGGGAPEPEHEPIYGPTYLPRKFKMAVSLPEDNCVDVYANDLGMLAVHEGGKVVGWNVLVGGGSGVTPSAKKTFPAVAKAICFVPDADAIRAAEAVVKLQRDHGNRSDRKVARVKYVVANWGVPKFKAVLEEYFGGPLADPAPVQVSGVQDHLGWEPQGDGKFFYGLYVENGRIKDEGEYRLKSALRAVLAKFPVGIRLTAHQNILFTDLNAADKDAFLSVFRSHGVPLTEDRTPMRRLSMACPAWPTCGLSITEAERAHPAMMDALDGHLRELGLENEVFTLHMTGCPNGCARPYNCDIGIVGKAAGKYTIFAGGSTLGTRLNWKYRDMVLADDVIPTIRGLLERFKAERLPDERLGEYCDRVGPAALGVGEEVHEEVEAE